MSCNHVHMDAGDIVMISSYGTTKYLVCRGWYTYKGTRHNGWYFKSIPGGEIVPDYKVDISEVTIVSSSNGDCDCDCDNDCCHDDHCHPEPPELDCEDSTFITVDTLNDRNHLGHPYPPEGKIVRVNNVRGEVKYYVWNAEDLKWDVFEFPTNTEVSESLKELDNRTSHNNEEIDNIKKNLDWIYINKESE